MARKRPIDFASQHRVAKNSLWIHGSSIPFWGNGDLPAAFCGNGDLPAAAHTLRENLCLDNEEVIHVQVVSLVAALRACAKNKDLCTGTRVHHDVLNCGLVDQCADALVTMYAKCGALLKAEEILHLHKSRDVFPWTDVIAGYAQLGQGQDALQCFERMLNEGLSPDAVTLACILKSCGSIRAVVKGEQIHKEILRRGLLRNDVVLGTAVVDMYAKCGNFTKALQVLEEIPARNVVSWTALITGFTQQCQAQQALDCFEQMQHDGLSPNAMTFVCILRACGSLGAADKGEHIYEEILRQGLLENDTVLGTAVIDMFAKCGALEKAQKVFEELPCRNIVSWNAMIAGYAQKSQGEKALLCFERLQREGLSPNAVTFLCTLKACGSLGAICKGEQLHDEISRQSLASNNTKLGNALVDMYAKCGCLVKAQHLLEKLPVQDVVSWNALLTGYTQEGQSEQALNCFEQLQDKGVFPDAVTLLCILKACGMMGLVNRVQMYIMNMGTKYGVEPDIRHYTCMVDAFGRAGHLDKVIRVMHKLPSFDHSTPFWSAILGACKKWGNKNVGRWAFEKALRANISDVAG